MPYPAGCRVQLEGNLLKKEGVLQEPMGYRLYICPAVGLSAEMALTHELYGIPVSKLDSFVAQWLQPSRQWKEEVLEVVRTVEQFLREEFVHWEQGLDQEVRVLKVVKVRPGPSVPTQRRRNPV